MLQGRLDEAVTICTMHSAKVGNGCWQDRWCMACSCCQHQAAAPAGAFAPARLTCAGTGEARLTRPACATLLPTFPSAHPPTHPQGLEWPVVFTPMFCNQFFPWPGGFAKVSSFRGEASRYYPSLFASPLACRVHLPTHASRLTLQQRRPATHSQNSQHNLTWHSDPTAATLPLRLPLQSDLPEPSEPPRLGARELPLLHDPLEEEGGSEELGQPGLGGWEVIGP